MTEADNPYLKKGDPEEMLQMQFDRYAHATDVVNGKARFEGIRDDSQLGEALDTFKTVGGLVRAIRKVHIDLD